MLQPSQPRPGRSKVGRIVILVAVGIVGGILAGIFPFSGFLPLPRLPSGPEAAVLAKVDEDWILRSLEGQNVRLSGLRGKVVFLNIWATWCPPCVAEVPAIQKLHDSMKDEEVAFLLVSSEAPEHVHGFVGKKQWRVPVYTPITRMPNVFVTDGIPATFILNRQGDVVFSQVGSANWNARDSHRFLHALLAQRSTLPPQKP